MDRYKYISLLEGPVAENLEIVEMCKEIKEKLAKYETIKSQLDVIEGDMKSESEN